MESSPSQKRILLDVIEQVLIAADRPMNVGELTVAIIKEAPDVLSGRTPEKTVNARISMDILRSPETSRFVRTGRGRFSLRGKGWELETVVPRRQIAPIDEDILVVPTEALRGLLGKELYPNIYKIDRVKILENSTVLRRDDAEKTEEYVQIIPTFVIKKDQEILYHQRTKKLPESRLHNTMSCNFGGHLQSDDSPTLFFYDERVVDLFYMRELNEELKFSCNPKVEFIGALYLTGSSFERQHVGLVFIVSIPSSCIVTSLEPGYHTNLRFRNPQNAEGQDHDIENDFEVDSWSFSIQSMMRAIK